MRGPAPRAATSNAGHDPRRDQSRRSEPSDQSHAIRAATVRERPPPRPGRSLTVAALIGRLRSDRGSDQIAARRGSDRVRSGRAAASQPSHSASVTSWSGTVNQRRRLPMEFGQPGSSERGWMVLACPSKNRLFSPPGCRWSLARRGW